MLYAIYLRVVMWKRCCCVESCWLLYFVENESRLRILPTYERRILAKCFVSKSITNEKLYAGGSI
jgi:hypothetical protein